SEPAADPASPAKDLDAEAWKTQWEIRAQAAVLSSSRLAFVHILRVDSAGHKHGVGAVYKQAAAESDAILGKLVASDPSARWFVAACASLVLIRGEPTLSMRMIYAPEGRDMYLTWAPALVLAIAATWFGLRRTTIVRVVISQLALPIAAAAAVVTACGGWPVV